MKMTKKQLINEIRKTWLEFRDALDANRTDDPNKWTISMTPSLVFLAMRLNGLTEEATNG